MGIKLLLLFVYVLHFVKGILLYNYNKKLNPSILFSDIMMYVLIISPKLYIEDGPKSTRRSAILALHYFTLFFVSVLFVYAIVLVW